MEEDLFHCIPQRRKTSSIVSHNGGKYLLLWDTTEENLRRCGIQGERFFWDTVHRIRFCRCVGYNIRKTPALWDTMEKNLLAILRLFSVVSYNRKKPFLLYPTTKKTFSVVSYNRKNPSVVSHNGKKRKT